MDNTELELTETTEDVSSEAMVIYEQDKAEIDVQIATAKKYSRNVTKATNNAIAIITMSEDIAATCNYAVPRGGKQITGPSVHLARILAQNWGNLRVSARVVGIDAKHVTSEAVCFDLENNLAVKTQVKRSIVGKYGRFNEDMITVTGNAANAIAYRNAVFSVIPKGIIDQAYKAAKMVIVGDVSDANKLKAKRKAIVDALKGVYEVTEAEIFKAVGKSSIDHLGEDELVVLKGFGQAIKDGDTTVDSVFRPQVAVKSKDDAAYSNLTAETETAKTKKEKTEGMGK